MSPFLFYQTIIAPFFNAKNALFLHFTKYKNKANFAKKN